MWGKLFLSVAGGEAPEGYQRPDGLYHGDGVDLCEAAVYRRGGGGSGEDEHVPLRARLQRI